VDRVSDTLYDFISLVLIILRISDREFIYLINQYLIKMLQIILAILIVLTALSFAVYRIVKYFKNPLHECEDCELGCGGCSLKELKNIPTFDINPKSNN